MIHYGWNTLPLPRFLRIFQKRFCRPEDGSERLFGYNHGITTKTIGPGYFVAQSSLEHPEWQERGAVVIDYFQIPDGPVSENWPKVIPNSKGIQVLVYHQTRDFMRKVSKNVSVGIAFKGEKALGQFFMLCKK